MTDDPSGRAAGPPTRALQETPSGRAAGPPTRALQETPSGRAAGPPTRALQETLSRRRLFGLAGASAAGIAGASLAACTSDSMSGPVVTNAADASSGPPFVSRPDLTPPTISIRRHGVPASPRYIFLNAPYSGPGHGGSYILDHHGHFVWFGPNTATHHRMNFDVQSYQGKPVLTWFQGLVVQGYGKGELIIADDSYKIRHVIRPPHGELADFHDFYLTQQGSAYITIYRTHSGIDLSSHGGPRNGYVISGVAQEIDIKTGELLWEWDSMNHVPLGESHESLSSGDGTKTRPYNYFHINSFSPAGDNSGDVLISGRNTFAIYRVKRNKAGTVVWRLNGKRSHFNMGPGSHFYWQHHVRAFDGGNRITVFDNGAMREERSRAIILHLDAAHRRATLRKAYSHPGKVLLASAMGSAQLLEDGGMFVGWGTQPYFSEFSRDGRLLLDGSITVGDQSYRAFTRAWSGHPTDPPEVGARPRAGGGAVVYASWNGATHVATWRVLAGKSRSALHEAGSGRRSGFETAIAVRSKGPYFAVQAHDAKGKLLAKSAVVKIG